MPFSKKVKEDAFVSCNRRCCLCDTYCGTKIEAHHILPESKGGQNTLENCIPVCFNCHAEVHEDANNPKGNKYSESELRRLREKAFKKYGEQVSATPSLNITNVRTIKHTFPNANYHSPSFEGIARFDYSNNNGRYCIGKNEHLFEIAFSKAGNTGIYVYNDPTSIATVALVKDVQDINLLTDVDKYDTSSRTRHVGINQIAVLKNNNGFYAAVKILSLKDDIRGDLNDEVLFEYAILSL